MKQDANVKCMDCSFADDSVICAKGNPQIIHCRKRNKRLVANSLRKCLSFSPNKPI